MSIDPIDTLPKMLTRRTEPPHERALQPPPRPTAPYLLIGLVSALIGRRDALRCTWLRALRSGPHAGAARVLFVVGNGAEDAGRPDVLSTAVEEQRQSKQTGSRRVRVWLAIRATWTRLRASTGFIANCWCSQALSDFSDQPPEYLISVVRPASERAYLGRPSIPLSRRAPRLFAMPGALTMSMRANVTLPGADH